MMGYQPDVQPKIFYHLINLDERIPANSVLRKISGLIDFDFIYQEVKDCYGGKGNVYAASPMFAFQKDFTSDNYEYRNLERFRKMLGGLKRIQKGIEFYRHHMFSIYAVQIVLILIVLIFLFYR